MHGILSNELRAQISAKIGTIDSCVNRSWEHADSCVFEINNAYIVKIFPQPRKFHQERDFYRQYQDRLQCTARFIAEFQQTQYAILLSKIDGDLVETTNYTAEQLLIIYRAAGKQLRHIHQQAISQDDPMPLGDAHLKRAQSWLKRAEGLCEESDIQWVSAQLLALKELNTTQRVPCHRDFTARNWIWNQDQLYVIDFEMSRPDWWLFDCERLITGAFHNTPALQDAFFDAYGKHPNSDELAILKSCSAVAALSTVVWSIEHNDEAFKQDGLARLARLKQLD